jgi:hypothetical protein
MLVTELSLGRIERSKFPIIFYIEAFSGTCRLAGVDVEVKIGPGRGNTTTIRVKQTTFHCFLVIGINICEQFLEQVEQQI